MNILLINHYAGSRLHGMEYRPFYMARNWSRLGHQVTIAAATRSHLRMVPPAAGDGCAEEDLDGVRYVWLPTPAYQGNGVRRALNMGAFVAQLLRRRRLVVGRHAPDLVIASSTYPLDVVAARRIARGSGARLVFEVHDLWPLTLTEMGMSKRHPFVLLMGWAERLAYRSADRVVSMLPLAAPHMEAHGMRPDKFRYVPNGIVVEEWDGDHGPLPGPHAEALDRPRDQGKFLVVYAGAHGLANSLETVVDAAARLRDTPATFVLVGQGPEKAPLERRAQELGVTNVVFLSPVPRSSVPALLARADALFIGLKRTRLFRFGVSPNKLMDYMMAGKPVIQAIEAGNDLVSESGCGLSIQPEDPRALADATARLMATSLAERDEMGRRGRAYVLAHHDYQVLARRFLEAVE